MFGFRSARGRAILVGLVLTLFLVGVTALTIWRNEDYNQQLDRLERASDAATALEHARAQLYLQMSLLSGLAFSQDASLVDEYRQVQTALEQDLIQARAEATARGDAAQLEVLDDLAARMAEFEGTANLAIPLLLQMDAPTAAEMAGSYLPTVWDTVDAMFVDLDRLAENGRTHLAAERAAMDREAGVTFWLIVARSAIAFVLTAGIATAVLLSILRPLASLRLSARAIAAGNLQARAKVFGPEEVASLADDFNQMTDALAAKTREYIATTNLTGDIIAKIDARARWTFLNDAACAFFGKPRERLLGSESLSFVHPEDAERTVQTVEEAQRTKEAAKGFVNRMITHAGTRVVEWNASPLFDDRGRYAGVQMTGRDITERKEAEEALRQAEQRYRELFEEAPAMYVVCRDKDGAPFVADCNELFVAALGYNRDEVVGRPVADFYTPESRALLLEGGGFQRALAGQFVAEERQLVTNDGCIVETVLRAVPEIGPDGRVLGTRAMYVDITERKRAEEALRESEERFSQVAESSRGWIWEVDSEGRYTYCSPVVKDLLGYEPEEVIGKRYYDLFTPEEREQLLPAAQAAFARKEAFFRLVNRNMHKEGHVVVLETTALPMLDAEGNLLGYRGVDQDVTERKRMDDALRESEARYRLLAENTSDLIWTMDLSLRYTYMSPAITRMRGYSVEEIVGTTVQETMTPASLEVARKALAEELAMERTGEADPSRSRKLELEMYCKDGSTIWTEMNMTFLRDSEGRPIGILGVTRDITQRKRAEKALEESERGYRLLAENATDIIWTMDMNLRFTYESPSVTRIRGYSPEEAMALTIEETLTPASLEVARKALAEELVPEKMGTEDLSRSRTLELEHTCKDGSTVWLEVTTTFLRGEDGRPVGLLGASRDISERKRAEKALRESEDKYRRLVEDSVDAIVIIEGLEMKFVNRTALEMFGCHSEEEMLGHPFTEFISPEYRKLMVERARARQKGQDPPSRYEIRALRKDGSEFPAELSVGRIAHEGRIALQGVVRDISGRKRMEDALRESEARYRLLTENTSDLIWTMDLSLKYTYMSPAITRMRGYSVEEIVGTTVQETMTPASLEVARKTLAEHLAREREGGADPNRSAKLELEMYCKDGSTIWTEMNMTFLRDSDGRPTGILGVTRDISERKRADEERKTLHAELETRAITDSLTGLYNHAYFYQRLAHEIERSERYGHRFALVMMDVDAFKHYNDSRGHQAGDEALRLVGECIRSAMRRSDMAFRYGGDEFVAILLNADVPRAQAVVRRVNRRIAARLKELGDSAGGWLGVSAGVACFPEDATTVDELVRMADGAMYDAKRLAWARGVMGRGGALESVAWPVETLHETQTRMLSGAANSLAAALQDLTAPQELSKTDLRTLAALGAAAEIKDPYIRGHQERTSRLAATVAKEMGLSPDRVRNITTAGLLHDLGKVSVGESILNKRGKLSESEFTKMKEHASLGATMIRSGVEALQPLAPIVRHHHERFDGSGYPDGLARDNIPLEARILSVADAFDAMTHERAYRKALSTQEALGEIQQGAGTRFDRAVVEAFLGVVRRRSGQLGC